MKTVTVRIKGSKQTLETSGFQGRECLDITEKIRQRLGGEILHEEEKAEIHETAEEVVMES